MSGSNAMRVLLAYPDTFADIDYCVTKVSRITRDCERLVILYSGDWPEVARACAKHLGCEIEIGRSVPNLHRLQATHAIVFDAGNDHVVEQCQQEKIPYRRIHVELCTVTNVDRGEQCDVYIGRGSVFGNPYALGGDGDREEVIRKFEYDFLRGLLTDRQTGMALKDLALQQLRAKALGCHCKPSACHGDVIARYVNRDIRFDYDCDEQKK